VSGFSLDVIEMISQEQPSISQVLRLLNRFAELMKNPTCLRLLLDQGYFNFFCSMFRAAINSHNGNDMRDDNQDDLAANILEDQRTLVNRIFIVATEWVKNEPAFKSFLNFLFDLNNIQAIFLGDTGGYMNNENKDTVAMGFVFLLNKCFSFHPNMTDEYVNKVIVSIGRFSEMINDISFGGEGGLKIVSSLHQSTNNPEHKVILEDILTHIVVTIGWQRNAAGGAGGAGAGGAGGGDGDGDGDGDGNGDGNGDGDGDGAAGY